MTNNRRPQITDRRDSMTEPYYTWQKLEATWADEPIRWAGKPGLESWDTISPPKRLLAAGLGAAPGGSVEAGQLAHRGLRLLDLRCGAGVCGMLAARRGALVTLCDDSSVAVEAARRTLALNGVSGQVIHGDEVAGPFDLVLLDAPRGREWTRHLLGVAAQVLRPGGKLLLAGPNRGGIKGFIQDASEIVGPCCVERVKAGCRLAVAEKSDQSSAIGDQSGAASCPQGAVPGSVIGDQLSVANDEWLASGEQRSAVALSAGHGDRICEATVRGQAVRFVTRPGVFSHGELDAGTRALVETMVIRPGDRVLDLGCGCGIVGAVAARTGDVVLVDSSAAALAASRRTLELNGARGLVLASDCASAVRDMRFDVVAANPPFHQGLGVEFDVAQQFVRDAADVLVPGGRLFLVANRFIRYERVTRAPARSAGVGDLFSRVTIAYQDSRFRVLEAAR